MNELRGRGEKKKKGNKSGHPPLPPCRPPRPPSPLRCHPGRVAGGPPARGGPGVGLRTTGTSPSVSAVLVSAAAAPSGSPRPENASPPAGGAGQEEKEMGLVKTGEYGVVKGCLGGWRSTGWAGGPWRVSRGSPEGLEICSKCTGGLWGGQGVSRGAGDPQQEDRASLAWAGGPQRVWRWQRMGRGSLGALEIHGVGSGSPGWE